MNNTLYGLKIQTNRFIPAYKSNFKLSDKLDLSDDFRIKYQIWLDDFFGKQPIVYSTNMGLRGTLIVHPSVAEEIRKKLESATFDEASKLFNF